MYPVGRGCSRPRDDINVTPTYGALAGKLIHSLGGSPSLSRSRRCAKSKFSGPPTSIKTTSIQTRVSDVKWVPWAHLDLNRKKTDTSLRNRGTTLREFRRQVDELGGNHSNDHADKKLSAPVKRHENVKDRPGDRRIRRALPPRSGGPRHGRPGTRRAPRRGSRRRPWDR